MEEKTKMFPTLMELLFLIIRVINKWLNQLNEKRKMTSNQSKKKIYEHKQCNMEEIIAGNGRSTVKNA